MGFELLHKMFHVEHFAMEIARDGCYTVIKYSLLLGLDSRGLNDLTD